MVSYFCKICKKNISKSNKAKHLKTQSPLKNQGGDRYNLAGGDRWSHTGGDLQQNI